MAQNFEKRVLQKCLRITFYPYKPMNPFHFLKKHQNHCTLMCIPAYLRVGTHMLARDRPRRRRAHEGGFRAHTVGGVRAGAESKLIALLRPPTLPFYSPPPTWPFASPPPTPHHPELIRNQQQTVRCTKGRSST